MYLFQNVPAGIEIALEKMKKKEKAELTLASKYAFGQRGWPERNVPPDSTVVYDLTLHDFERAKETWLLEAEEKVMQV